MCSSPAAKSYISINRKRYLVKNYYCAADDNVYIQRRDRRLWLYINLTDGCPASCPFCVNAEKRVSGTGNMIDMTRLGKCLSLIAGHVYGVSITGGEPMLYPDLVDQTAELIDKILPHAILDLATNGLNLDSILSMKMTERFEGIHLSRHVVDDEANRKLMGFEAPSREDIAVIIKQMSDPGKIVFNCVLQKGGVENLKQVRQYLEMAGDVGVNNTSFIGMFPANEYCRDRFVSPEDVLVHDSDFHIWNHFHDHDYCSCSSGSYQTLSGPVRYYYRSPGRNSKAPYIRQLVYTADNRLLDGFGGNEIPLSI